jgi:hypothetical protein
MNISSQLLQLITWMSGEFSNREQSLAQPAWFVNLIWWHCPIPVELFGTMAIFAEQANAMNCDRAYRQRVLQFKETEDKIEVQYWGFKDPNAWVGAGRSRDRLNQMTIDDLEPLYGCLLTVDFEQGCYRATMPEGAKCYFEYMNETRQVVLGFEVTEKYFRSGDRGVDPQTGAAIWGAVMDFYEFQKVQELG